MRKRQLQFWIITIQFLAALLPLSTRLPFPVGWFNLVPSWKMVNIAFDRLKPDERLNEKFLAKGEPGFEDLLDIIDRKFVELPHRESIRGITNRMDGMENGLGEKLYKAVTLWVDFGNGQYLPIASRRFFWEQVKAERVKAVLWISLGLLVFSVILRYYELITDAPLKIFRIDFNLLKPFITIAVIAGIILGCIILNLYNPDAKTTIPSAIIFIRIVISLSAVIVLFVTLQSFISDHIPGLKLRGARMNESRSLVYFEIKNYSKTLIKNMILKYSMFESRIENGKSCTDSDIGLHLFTLPHKNDASIGPVSSEEFVIDLNRLVSERSLPDFFNMDLFRDHVFLVVLIEYTLPFWPFLLRERGVLYYSNQHKEWFVSTLAHAEMRPVFSKLLQCLENNDVAEIKKFFEAGRGNLLRSIS